MGVVNKDKDLGAAKKPLPGSTEAAAAATTELTDGVRVRAIALGFYGNTRRRPGDEFRVASEVEVGAWMVALDDDVQARAIARRAKAEADRRARAAAKAAKE